MNIEQKLYKAAIDLIERRYPTGWGGAAAMYTEGGQLLTSVAPDVINASTELCMETGAMNYGFELDGIIGLDFLQRLKAIINIDELMLSSNNG